MKSCAIPPAPGSSIVTFSKRILNPGREFTFISLFLTAYLVSFTLKVDLTDAFLGYQPEKLNHNLEQFPVKKYDLIPTRGSQSLKERQPSVPLQSFGRKIAQNVRFYRKGLSSSTIMKGKKKNDDVEGNNPLSEPEDKNESQNIESKNILDNKGKETTSQEQMMTTSSSSMSSISSLINFERWNNTVDNDLKDLDPKAIGNDDEMAEMFFPPRLEFLRMYAEQEEEEERLKKATEEVKRRQEDLDNFLRSEGGEISSQTYDSNGRGTVVSSEIDDFIAQGDKKEMEMAQLEELKEEEQKELFAACKKNWESRPVALLKVDFLKKSGIQGVQLRKDFVLYGSSSGYISVSSIENGGTTFRSRAHTAQVTALDFTEDYLISAGEDYAVVIHKKNQYGGYDKLHQVVNHQHRIVAAAMLDENTFYSGSIDGKIVISSLITGEKLRSFTTSDIMTSCTHVDGYIFCGHLSGILEAFSVKTGRGVFFYSPQRCAIRSLNCISLGETIKVVTGGQDSCIRQFYLRPEGAATAWRMERETEDERLTLMCTTHVGSLNQGYLLRGHTRPVISVKADERKIVSASEDGSVIVWDSFRGIPVYSIPYYDPNFLSSVDFNDRYLVADGFGRELVTWDYAVDVKSENNNKG